MGVTCSRVVVCHVCANPCTHVQTGFYIKVYSEHVERLICCQECLPQILLVRDGLYMFNKNCT